MQHYTCTVTDGSTFAAGIKEDKPIFAVRVQSYCIESSEAGFHGGTKVQYYCYQGATWNLPFY